MKAGREGGKGVGWREGGEETREAQHCSKNRVDIKNDTQVVRSYCAIPFSLGISLFRPDVLASIYRNRNTMQEIEFMLPTVQLSKETLNFFS
jgi:hypothetical protein